MRPIEIMIPLLVGDTAMTRTMLSKLVFWADAIHFHANGCTISGEQHLKLTHGPITRNMTAVRQHLVRSGILKETVSSNGLLRRFSYRINDAVSAEAGRTHLPEDAVKIIDQVRNGLGNKPASFLTSAMHSLEPWKSHWIGDVLDMERIRANAEFARWLNQQGLLH